MRGEASGIETSGGLPARLPTAQGGSSGEIRFQLQSERLALCLHLGAAACVGRPVLGSGAGKPGSPLPGRAFGKCRLLLEGPGCLEHVPCPLGCQACAFSLVSLGLACCLFAFVTWLEWDYGFKMSSDEKRASGLRAMSVAVCLGLPHPLHLSCLSLHRVR